MIVATTAPIFGRIAGRIGQRQLVVPGGLLWGFGAVFLILRATTTPDYVGTYLPAVICTAFGVALCLPQLSSAAVQGLPADQFGSGSAVGQAFRYIGATLGVALVIALTSGVTADSALDGFHHVWWLLAVCGVIVSLLASRLVRIGAPAAPELAAAAAH
jgi:MFS family permease